MTEKSGTFDQAKLTLLLHRKMLTRRRNYISFSSLSMTTRIRLFQGEGAMFQSIERQPLDLSGFESQKTSYEKEK